MNIKCTSFKDPHFDGCYGIVELLLVDYGIVVKGIQIKKTNDETWLKFPSKEYEKDGEKKYFRYFYFPNREDNEEFTQHALSAIREKMREN